MRNVVFFCVIIVAFTVYGQSVAPEWIHETWRNTHYPLNEWYVGFSVDNVEPYEKLVKSIERVEHYAMNKMVENISVRISSSIQAKEMSYTNNGGGFVADYRQTINSSTSAEIANLERRSYHDRESGRIYAFAAIRRQDFAAHCVSRAENYLQKAENSLIEAKLLSVGTKKNEAVGRVTENLDECARYLDLLAAVNRESGELRHLRTREADLRKQIFIKEKVAVYVAGKETKSTQGLHRILGSELAKEVNASGYYSAVDRTGHTLDLPVDDKQIKDLGQQLGVEYLCIAEVSPTRGGEYDLIARLVSAVTADERVSVSAHSSLEGAKEMRLASAQLASGLMGKDSIAKTAELELRKREELAAEKSDVKPITEESRQSERAALDRATFGSEYQTTEYSSPTSIPHPIFGNANSEAYQEKSTLTDGSVGCEPDGWPRYGIRFAVGTILGDGQSGDGSQESKSTGMSVSAGLTISFPITKVISFNPELIFDIMRMDLSVTPPEAGLYGENGAMEYAISLPLLVRAEVSYFYAEAGLAFGYPLQSGLNFADAKRAQIEMCGTVGIGLAFGASASMRHYIGYRFENNITDFDDKAYCRVYRHSLGYSILF